MKRAVMLWLAVFMSGMVIFCSTQGAVLALSATQMLEFSQNDILFYDPSVCSDNEGDDEDSCYNLDELTWEDLEPLSTNDRLKLIVEHYGEFAMQLQKYYGIPWEMPFAIMVYESQVGTDNSSIPNSHAKAAKDFNTMGMTLFLTDYTDTGWIDDPYDDENLEPWCGTIGGQYNCFNGYKTISQQLLGYFIYHGRNGRSYDDGMKLLTLDHYEENLDEALRLIMSSFCTGSCYNDGIRPIIRTGSNTEYTGLLDVIKEKNWKNSYELAKAWNIQPGGIATQKWGWGDIREQIWKEYGATGLPDCTTGSGEAIARTAIELAWPDDQHLKEDNPAFIEAAKELGSYGWMGEKCRSQDCGYFVSVVVLKSGVDPNFPKYTEAHNTHTGVLLDYLKNSDKWEEIENKGSEENLKPGDIFVFSAGSGENRHGHIKIYLGDMGGGSKIAEASMCDFTGMLNNDTAFVSDTGETFRIFRIKTKTKQTAGGGVDALVETAKKLAWAEGQLPSDITTPNSAYVEAARRRGGGFITRAACQTTNAQTGICSSCANFVSLVISESGVDPEFEKNGNPKLLNKNSGLKDYLDKSENWERVSAYNGGSTKELNPGDIMIGFNLGHTFIYLGDNKVADASNMSQAGGSAARIHQIDSTGYLDGSSVAYRLAKGGGASNTSEIKLHTPTNAWLSNAGLEGFKALKALNSALGDGRTIDDSAMIPGTDSYTTFAEDAGDGAGLPGFIILHWTAVNGYDGSESGADYYWQGFSDGTWVFPPHFTIDVVNKRIWQHFPLSSPSAAVATGDGVVWDRYAIQIEVVGSNMDSSGGANDPRFNIYKFTDDQYDYLAKLLIAISDETGIPLISDLEWDENAADLSTPELKAYIGVLGHEHIIGNGKIDPGKMWDYIKPALERLGYTYNGGGGSNDACGNDDTKGSGARGTCFASQLSEADGGCTEDNYTYYWQGGPTWADDDYACETIAYAACGPSAMAMIVTALSGQMITPREAAVKATAHSAAACKEGSNDNVRFIAEDYGLKVEPIADSVEEINKALKEGKMIITSIGPGSGLTGGSGHFIGIRKLTDSGKWKLFDSSTYYNGNFYTNINDMEFDPAPLVYDMSIHTGSSYAISK